ncbi:MAG: hypothetical protein N2049_06645 [Anaerolineales bacterium]|nr:hypothetical protein [Anaerolineales bacterium]
MKTKPVMLVLLISVLGLGVSILLYQNSSRLAQPTISVYAKPILPQVDWPLPNAEELSLTEAKARIPYSIPLPEGFEIRRIWATKDTVEVSERSVAVEFTDDLLLIIHPMKQAPDWDGIIAIAPSFIKVDINGNLGIGTDPGYTEINGVKHFHPGSVEWWVNGLELDITLYSNTYTLDELLKVAQSIR